MGDIIYGQPLIFMHILIGTNERVVCVEVDQNEALSEPTKVKDYSLNRKYCSLYFLKIYISL